MAILSLPERDKYSGSYNSIDDLPTKSYINLKETNMITNKNEAKAMVQVAIQIKIGIMRNANARVKSNLCAKAIIIGILAHVFVTIASI